MQIRNFLKITLASAMMLSFVGCAEKSEVKEQTKITTPDGTKTITNDTKVETTGNPSSTTTTPIPK